MNKVEVKKPAGYEDDFALWSAEQAALIRAGRFDRIDVENVAEEIESLGRSDKHEILSRMAVILLHLLKWQYQPSARSPSWQASIVTNRDAIAVLIEQSPSLQSYPDEVIKRAYKKAPRLAALETGLRETAFPAECPYSADEVLDDDFWPEAA
ncbi:MAG: DUF29 domain-containing protein [Devosia sp.]|uniref:DUF29 domain-containing protein n=1 Tax=Devosia sp. TaxID=1871048 RepID=UPI001AD3BB94|nr:DUF29 domain-containing protein [Devosia sp.]MBN9316526.1 DUF29 domain-containing protein [Devosia sp.]